MNNNILKISRRWMVAGLGVLALGMTACNPEPDESDLYTFTGKTIDAIIKEDSTLTLFHQIMQQTRYDKLMAAYGHYTCFAPTNDAIIAYCDSLYDDTEAVIPHNGMTERTVDGLTDSLRLDLVRYHLTYEEYDAVKLTRPQEISTMLGYDFTVESKPDSLGRPIINKVVTVIETDREAVNGLVHLINAVIPRQSRLFDYVFDHNPQYSLFAEALALTGLYDSISQHVKPEKYVFTQKDRANYSGKLYSETQFKKGYTVLAETNDVLKAALRKEGLSEDINGLIAYANKVYGDAPDWYDYMSENGLTVSTGTDYTNRFNALNMFVAYHIIPAAMTENQLVLTQNVTNYWHFKPDVDLYDYYETMLPHTLVKAWAPYGMNNQVFLNRYQTYNTLTNEVGTTGTSSFHEVIQEGVKVLRNQKVDVLNGYILSINDMLVYDRTVPKNVLNERLRFNVTSLLPELINNRYRYWDQGTGNIPSGYDNSRMGLPQNCFDNIVVFDKGTCFVYCLHGAMRCFESDMIQFWGSYDFAFKLPPVPSGTYEMRIIYPPLSYGGFAQYYFGTSTDGQSMEALGLPVDMTIDADDPRIGWTKALEEEDQGIETDIAMHNRGYMRAPYSFFGGTGVSAWTENNACRNEGPNSVQLRQVLGRKELSQKNDNWIRIKTLNPEDPQTIMNLDFIELVPVSVVDNPEYAEDWY